MDIEMLIEQLRWWADHCDRTNYGCHARTFLLDAATALSTLQAENEKLRAELNDMKAKWDKYQPREHWETLNELRKNLHDELERVKAERDAAIEYLREIEWCAGCKHFGGLDGCKKWVIGQCTGKHDLYDFIGSEKED